MSLMLLVVLAACRSGPERPGLDVPSPVPTLTTVQVPGGSPSPAATRVPSQTPTRKPTSTAGLTPSPSVAPSASPTPHCNLPQGDGAWLVLDNEVFAYPGPSPADLDRSLNRVHPHWSEFQQQLDWYDEPVSAGEVVDDAAFAATFEVNSAVVLVTVGVQRDWRLPLNGDLFTLARVATYHLNRHFWDYVFNENNVQSRVPDVVNAATYAVYAFFDFDQAALGAWCEAYTALYGQSPLYLP